MNYEKAVKQIGRIQKDYLRGVMDAEETWHMISEFVYSETPNQAGTFEPKCTCLIKHAITKEEQTRISTELEVARSTDDVIGVVVALAQLQECPTKDFC